MHLGQATVGGGLRIQRSSNSILTVVYSKNGMRLKPEGSGDIRRYLEVEYECGSKEEQRKAS